MFAFPHWRDYLARAFPPVEASFWLQHRARPAHCGLTNTPFGFHLRWPDGGVSGVIL